MTRADGTKIREELGFEPRVPFGEGLRETVDWYRNHPGWWAAGQAAHARYLSRSSTAVCLDTAFLRYVEFDQPCLITAEPAEPDAWGRNRVKVSAVQSGGVRSPPR